MTSEPADEGVALPDSYALASDLRSYLPGEYPEREAEMGKLIRVLGPASQGWQPGNGEVIGPAGQGKTAAVTMLTEKLRQRHHITPLYVDCTVCRSRADVWVRLLEQALIEQHRHLPFGDITGPNSSLIRQFEDATREIGGIIVVVLDDLDLEESVNDLLFQLSRFDVEKVKLGSIVISKNPEFRMDAERDTMGTWSPTRVQFQQYDETALVSILRRRIELLGSDSENGITQSLESVAGRVIDGFGGSARAGIDIFREARSRSRNAEKIGEEHIEDAVNWYRNYLMMEELGQVELPSKAVVVAVISATAAVDGQTPTVKEVYSVYCEVTEETGVCQFAEVTFREKLDAWIDTGLLKQTTDGVVPGLKRELMHEAVLYHGGGRFRTQLTAPEY